MSNISLLGSTTRIQTPFIRVTIGNYTFGVHDRQNRSNYKDSKNFYISDRFEYPNYIQSLSIKKVNGQVNTYTLDLVYPITQSDDPNFFEKVLSSVSKTRKIIFSYGDMSLPTFVYKNEEAIITNVATQFNIQSSSISYSITAVSAAALAKSGSYTFINKSPKKPSDEIKRILYNSLYGLQDIFYGMNNKELVEQYNLIAGDDKVVQLESKTNISILDYLTYLVSCMVPSSSDSTQVKQQDIYIMTVVDDTSGVFGGPYFRIVKNTSNIDNTNAYDIDIGFATKDIVTGFSIDNSENYSILYNWQEELNSEKYSNRINNSGEWYKAFAPTVSSKNDNYLTRTSDKVWWTKVTSYPISATLTIKGLLRPAILMTHVRVNILFYGNKHINSGLYVVTQQVDRVDSNGYSTTLSITRIPQTETSD